ncbi:MAG TPA: hypothetical protein VFI94_18650 [Pseudolabrys sp.]|nr:hypothetical protein [Pseudolabrys sp.]
MAKRREIEAAGDEGVPDPGNARPNVELPFFASPSISPAGTEAVGETPAEPSEAGSANEMSAVAGRVAEEAPAATPDIQAPKRPSFILRPRHKRHALLAASVVLAAALGAVVGAAATGAFSKPAIVDATAEENKATQQTVARLAQEITSLKASLEAASKSANSQIAKIGERLNREGAGVTNSITPPQTVAAASQASAPSRLPAASESRSRLPIVTNWSIRETRGGYLYVQGNGDVYQVVPGAPLPGLGPVEKIERHDGRWLVVTPKGIIISMRDRRYFEQF